MTHCQNSYSIKGGAALQLGVTYFFAIQLTYMSIEFSPNLVIEIKEALRKAKPPELFWDQRDELSPRQMNLIIAFPGGLSDLEMEIQDGCSEQLHDLEMELIKTVLKNLRDEIVSELNIFDHELSDELLTDIIDELNLYDYIPSVNIGLRTLLRQSQPRVVMQLPLDHPFPGYRWRHDAQYDDVEAALAFFRVNPHSVDERFPDMPERNGYEYLSASDIVELWDNASYGGQYVVPLELDLWEYSQHQDQFHSAVVLSRGADIWLHDYWNGSGAGPATLLRDLTIVKEETPYSFGDDNDTFGYGLDQVYGLTQSAWSSTITALPSDSPTPHTLPVEETVVEHLMYGNVIGEWQNSKFIRPFNDYRPNHDGTIPAPGEMMAWDIKNSLWKGFPAAGRRYLKEEADKEVYHCAFRIWEAIGQVPFIHADFLINDKTGTIVWASITDNQRSRRIMELVKEKLKKIRTRPI